MRSLLPLACAFLALTSSLAAEKPNVLFIAIDDLNDWAGVFGGHPKAKTPNLDRFAEQGAMVFQNAHCPGPVCGPSRSAILSGYMPHRSGIYGNSTNMLGSPLVRTHTTLPEYFSRNGYITMSMGKIAHAHYTPNGTDRGQWMYDTWNPTTGINRLRKETLTSRDQNLIRGKPGPPSDFTEGHGSPFSYGVVGADTEETSDYRTAAWAAEQLGKQHDKPFFLAVGISKPHLPFYSPQEFWDLFPEDGEYAPEIREDDLDDILLPNGKPGAKPSMDYLWLKQNGLVNECARAYLACCSYADHCLGVVFDALKNSPHADNTIVIVWGDHGWHLGEKLRYRKAALWTESTRTPMMIRLPEMAQRRDCSRPVNLIDFYPTLIDLCSLPAKPELDGRSLVPLLKDPGRKWHPTLTINGHGKASVHDERWNLIRRKGGAEELYDLKTDPMEWTNLAANPEYAAEKKRLAAHLPTEFADSVPVLPKARKDALKKGRKVFDQTIRPKRLKLDLK